MMGLENKWDPHSGTKMLEYFIESIGDSSHRRFFNDHHISGLNLDVGALPFLELGQAILGGGLDPLVIGAQ